MAFVTKVKSMRVVVVNTNFLKRDMESPQSFTQ